MKMLTHLLVSVSFLFSFGVGVGASEEMHIPPYKGSEALESMKKLAGSWEGMHVMGEKEEPAKVKYQVSSNGSTVIETLFPGTQYEMITVYHDKDDALSMTHYCSLANQPQMDLVKAEANTIEFALNKTSNIDTAKDGHMHGLLLTMVDNDHIVHKWTMHQKGEEGGVTILKLARVQ